MQAAFEKQPAGAVEDSNVISTFFENNLNVIKIAYDVRQYLCDLVSQRCFTLNGSFFRFSSILTSLDTHNEN